MKKKNRTDGNTVKKKAKTQTSECIKKHGTFHVLRHIRNREM